LGEILANKNGWSSVTAIFVAIGRFFSQKHLVTLEPILQSQVKTPALLNFYNATGSLARFETNFFFYFELAYYNAGVVAVNLKMAGLAPDLG
jgi:hypothetical protein